MVAKKKVDNELNYVDIYQKEKQFNAVNMRYEKKQLEKIKIKQDLKQVKINIEKRESHNNKLIINDLSKLIKLS